MKLYYPSSHYNKSYRGLVFPLLKPFIKGKGFTDNQRIAMYNVSELHFEFTDTLEDSDVVILTMAWNYYVKTKQTKIAIDFIEECDALGLKVLVVNGGDFGVRIPYFKNLICLRFGGYKSKFSKNEFALPPFIQDPLIAHFNREAIVAKPHLSKPIIGFCGQANASYLNTGKETLRTVFRNLKFHTGNSPNEPQQILSTSMLRASVLGGIQESPKVVSEFILRKEYRAGIRTNKDSHSTTREFYDNLESSNYVVCVRGAGNFSTRFYETLAMGRIPIFINTDCALPFDEELEWKKHVVWVDYKERSKVTDKVVDFHSALSDKDFIDLQRNNRKLWEERLTLGGFFKYFLRC